MNARSKAFSSSAPTCSAVSRNRFDCSGSSGFGAGLGGMIYLILPIQWGWNPVNSTIAALCGDKAKLFGVTPNRGHPPRRIDDPYCDIGLFKLSLPILGLKNVLEGDLIFFVDIKPFDLPSDEFTPRGAITLSMHDSVSR